MSEAMKLAPILRGMCEGGGEEQGVDIYADDYLPGDGDVFVIRAAELLEAQASRIVAVESQLAAPVRATTVAAPWLPGITAEEMSAFHRFCDCCEDFDSGGHDVPKGMMSRLARIGLVRSCGFGRHETTEYGDAVRALIGGSKP